MLPREYERGEDSWGMKVGGNSTKEVTGTWVTKPRY